MYLKVANELKDRLSNFKKEGIVVLDLDDGVGKYSKLGVCSLDTSFRLLVLSHDQDRSDYTLDIDSNVGEIPIKEYSKIYLDDQMNLEYDDRLALIKLKSPSGVIDGNVPIIDLRK